jgi:signal transduction histidine kinase
LVVQNAIKFVPAGGHVALFVSLASPDEVRAAQAAAAAATPLSPISSPSPDARTIARSSPVAAARGVGSGVLPSRHRSGSNASVGSGAGGRVSAPSTPMTSPTVLGRRSSDAGPLAGTGRALCFEQVSCRTDRSRGRSSICCARCSDVEPLSPSAVLKFQVADTGCGIPSSRLADIFLPFAQVHFLLPSLVVL